jgi:hypothetical protein
MAVRDDWITYAIFGILVCLLLWRVATHSLRSSTLRNCKAKPLIATLMFCAVTATAAAMDRGQFKNVPPEIREWFENMQSPKGIMCCSYADGHRTGYEIRQGQYWVPIEGEWYPVPPEAVIKTENPLGEAIVWYLPHGAAEGDFRRSEWYKIICFVPLGDV